jgi:hypothetical protein
MCRAVSEEVAQRGGLWLREDDSCASRQVCVYASACEYLSACVSVCVCVCVCVLFACAGARTLEVRTRGRKQVMCQHRRCVVLFC